MNKTASTLLIGILLPVFARAQDACGSFQQWQDNFTSMHRVMSSQTGATLEGHNILSNENLRDCWGRAALYLSTTGTAQALETIWQKIEAARPNDSDLVFLISALGLASNKDANANSSKTNAIQNRALDYLERLANGQDENKRNLAFSALRFSGTQRAAEILKTCNDQSACTLLSTMNREVTEADGLLKYELQEHPSRYISN